MGQVTIPPEILAQIFSYLQFPDTASVSRVSRAWHTWSQEQLYADLCLRPCSKFPSLLLRTLLTPGLERLATYVRTLSLDWGTMDVEPLAESDLAVLTTAAVRLGIRQPARSPEEHVFLLFHLFSRLDVLKLKLPDEVATMEEFLSATHETSDLPLALQRIRHFSCTWPSREKGVTAEILLTMFRLPRIRTLEVFLLTEIRAEALAGHHRTSGVTGLEIPYSTIRVETLGRILHIPRALTHLAFMGVLGTDRGLHGLQNALETVRMTLQQLELYFEDNRWGLQLLSVPFLGLRAWPALRKLKCQLVVLLSSSRNTGYHLDAVLPPSLRELFLLADGNSDADEVVLELGLLVERKGQAVPVLERIGAEQLLQSEFVGQLASACVNGGVLLLGVEHWPGSTES